MILLFFAIIFITFIRASLTRIVSYAFQLCTKNRYNDLLMKQNEIKSMVAELDKISMTEEWAKYVKMQRRINKTKADLSETRKDLTEEKERAVASYVKYVNFPIFLCVMLTFFIYDRSVVVAQIPEDWLGWPFSRLLFWSSTVPGGITLPCWMIISSRVAQLFASEMT